MEIKEREVAGEEGERLSSMNLPIRKELEGDGREGPDAMCLLFTSWLLSLESL